VIFKKNQPPVSAAMWQHEFWISFAPFYFAKNHKNANDSTVLIIPLQ
jgi:hypothetical protein